MSLLRSSLFTPGVARVNTLVFSPHVVHFFSIHARPSSLITGLKMNALNKKLVTVKLDRNWSLLRLSLFTGVIR